MHEKSKIFPKKLPKFLQARQKNAELLTELLSKSNLTLPIQRKHEKAQWQNCVFIWRIPHI